MTRFMLADLRTGRRLLQLPVTRASWNDRLGAAENIDVTVPMRDTDVQKLDLLSAASPAKAILAVLEGDTVMAMGPIWTADYDRDAGTLQLGAAGMASLFDHRLILPVLAKSLNVTEWTIPDPADESKTIANPDLTTSFSGLSLGTIAKRLVEQAMLWTGGSFPIVYPDDELGTHERDDYLGVDFKPVGEALSQLSEVEGGPEINFQGRLTSDKLGLETVMETGTETQPLITSDSVISWSLTAPESPISRFRIRTDASEMGSYAWFTGGRQDDEVLVARAHDSTLVDHGYPLMDLLDSSHTTVSEQSTLDSYAVDAVAEGRLPEETWSFDVQAHPVDDKGRPAGPQVGSYRVGDFCDIHVDPYNKDTDTGDPYLAAGGVYRRRIVSLSGDEQGRTISIDCAPVRE